MRQSVEEVHKFSDTFYSYRRAVRLDRPDELRSRIYKPVNFRKAWRMHNWNRPVFEGETKTYEKYFAGENYFHSHICCSNCFININEKKEPYYV